MANPYRSSQGLSSGPMANTDEIQLRIGPIHADLNEEIWGMHKQVRQLKNVAQDIETEARIQNDIVSDLVIIFGLACFTIVYLWSKHLKR